MTTTSTEPVPLDVEDFRRLGVRPNELRLAVIRKAAARTTRSLAQQHLRSPSPQIALQLSRIATSAYRLLDPRKRSVAHHRAHVGRILPNTLTGAGQTNFFSRDTVSGLEAATPFQSPEASSDAIMNDNDWMVTLDIASQASQTSADTNQVWISTLSDGDLLDTTPLSRRLKRIRSRIFHPWVWISITGLTIGTILGLVTIAPHLDGRHFRLVNSTDDAERVAETSSVLNPESSLAKTETKSTSPVEFLDDPFDVVAINGRSPSPIAASVTETPDPILIEPDTATSSASTDVATQRIDEDPAVPPTATAMADPSPAREVTDHSAQVANQRHPIPSSDLNRKSLRALHDLVPALASAIESEKNAELIGQLQVMAAKLSPGSADHWVMHFTIAQLTWAEPSLLALPAMEAAQASLLPLTQNYQISPTDVLASTFLASLSPSPTELVSGRTVDRGIALCETLLVEGEFGRCERVAKALVRKAQPAHANAQQEAVEYFVQSSQQMDRLYQTVERVIERAGGLENVSTVASEAGMLGRYECLMCRHWNPKSLSWLAQSSDVRITASARDEIALAENANSDEIAKVAQRWLSASVRENGRSAESMQLHAIELLDRAANACTGLKKLELQRLIDEQTGLLPGHLRERLTTTSIKVNDSTPGSGTQKPVPTESTQEASTRPLSGMSGRVLVADGNKDADVNENNEPVFEDVGVQIDYQLDVAITPSMIETIRSRLDPKPSQWVIRLACELPLDEAAEVSFSVAPGIQDDLQKVSVDGESIEFDPLESKNLQSLSAGIHRIEWTVNVERVTSKVFLGIHDARTGNRMPIVAVDPSKGTQIPTTLTVAVVRTDD